MESMGVEHQRLDQPVTGALQPLARRHFLRASVRAGLGLGMLCVGTALVPAQDLPRPSRQRGGGYFPLPPEAASDPLLKLTRASFAHYNGDYFETIQDTGEKLIISLLRIEDLPSQRELRTKRGLTNKRVEQIKEESFSLIFRGPVAIPLRQRIHRLTHPALGEMELFLVPVGQDDGSRYYEVVFNRTLQ
jgi:hypothetical protein